MPNYSLKKIWSPNSPFYGQAVFSMERAVSWCRAGKARMATMVEALVSLTSGKTPRTPRARLVKMGMPDWNGDMVLVFNPAFVVAMHDAHRIEQHKTSEDVSEDAMIDLARGGKGRRGMAKWVSRGRQTMPGGPVQKTRQMTIVFKKEKKDDTPRHL